MQSGIPGYSTCTESSQLSGVATKSAKSPRTGTPFSCLFVLFVATHSEPANRRNYALSLSAVRAIRPSWRSHEKHEKPQDRSYSFSAFLCLSWPRNTHRRMQKSDF